MSTYLSYQGGNDLTEETRAFGTNAGWGVVTLARSGGTVLAPVWPSFTFAILAVANVSYSQDFDLYPAASPTTYSVVSGALPTGLSLSNVSGDIGRISGTPTAVGTFSFTLRASNAYGTADKAFSIVVASSAGSGGAWAFVS